MPIRLTATARHVYNTERRAAATALDPATRWRHLERAHIVAQPFAIAHVSAHAAMLRQAIRDRDLVEVLGQALRVTVAAPPSLTGSYPAGNTGRARVPLRARMPLPDDLTELLPSPRTPRRR